MKCGRSSGVTNELRAGERNLLHAAGASQLEVGVKSGLPVLETSSRPEGEQCEDAAPYAQSRMTQSLLFVFPCYAPSAQDVC